MGLLFNLFGRLGLDTKPFDQSVDRAERKAVTFADRVEKKVGKKLDKAFGSGLVTGAIISQVHQFFDLFKAGGEQVKGIGDLMDKTHLGAEAVQALQLAAKEANQPVEEFIKTVAESGAMQATIERIKELRKQVALTGAQTELMRHREGFWSAFKEWAGDSSVKGYWMLSEGLTYSKRKAELQSEGLSGKEAGRQAMRELVEAQKQEKKNDDSQFQNDLKELERLFGPKVDATKARPEPREKGYALNSWQSIGAYVGVPGDQLYREQQKTNTILQRLELIQREQLRILANNDGALV